uniref:Uncharacterized protein n=1 Tax=Desertifilum tharense IPPAS B-1220 TaxID=1781255 RepID=A0ACD5GVY7_9CYAN
MILPYGVGNDWQENLQKIAQIADRRELAQNAIAQHQQRIAQVRQNLAAAIQERSRILVLVGNQLDRGLRVEGNTTSCGSLLENIGFELVLPPTRQREVPIYRLKNCPSFPPILFYCWVTTLAAMHPKLRTSSDRSYNKFNKTGRITRSPNRSKPVKTTASILPVLIVV